ncbi:MAG: CRISPR-associated endonuclease Cas1 [Synechococcaceae cyanobacterium SM2_3_1]|nr:CRISPR-associated endonuclease Cas1 [Synechococcaceae cyanobacterium SM2_3_1]
MDILYIVEQGCQLVLSGEQLRILRREEVLNQVPLPLLEGILVFGITQLSTQAIRACLQRRIPVVYLSRSGFCYGRALPMGWPAASLRTYQDASSANWRLSTARQIVQAKVLNGRVLLLRQARRNDALDLKLPIESLTYLTRRLNKVETLQEVRGLEGAAAAIYFPALGSCLKAPFVFSTRSRRPPTNPVNAMLSFGYQVLWNHLLLLIELQGLDPYSGTLHTAHHGNAALASDLLEEFRAPVIDSLMVWLVNTRMVQLERDFEYRDGGCFLNESGRRQFLQAFVHRMSGQVQVDPVLGAIPRWHLLTQQVKLYRQSVLNSDHVYQPYRID